MSRERKDNFCHIVLVQRHEPPLATEALTEKRRGYLIVSVQQVRPGYTTRSGGNVHLSFLTFSLMQRNMS